MVDFTDDDTLYEPVDAREIPRSFFIGEDGKLQPFFGRLFAQEIDTTAFYDAHYTSRSRLDIAYGIQYATLDSYDGKLRPGHTMTVFAPDGIRWMNILVREVLLTPAPARIKFFATEISDAVGDGEDWDFQIKLGSNGLEVDTVVGFSDTPMEFGVDIVKGMSVTFDTDTDKRFNNSHVIVSALTSDGTSNSFDGAAEYDPATGECSVLILGIGPGSSGAHETWRVVAWDGPGNDASIFATSVSNSTIGLGTQTFLAQADKFFPENYIVLIKDLLVEGNYEFARITNYAPPVLLVDVIQVFGAGSSTAWSIKLFSGPIETAIATSEDWGLATSGVTSSLDWGLASVVATTTDNWGNI